MGTKLLRVCVKEESDEFPSVPPGFESYSSFTLKKVQDSGNIDSDNLTSCSASESATHSELVKMEVESTITSSTKITRSLRRRPWINYGQHDNCPEDDCDSGQHDQNFPQKPSLPKGVIRGCPECSDCQKVTARWRPEDARKPDIEDAPVFYPTEEEFEDTLNYIASIRPKAEQYGICRIVPPPSWKPPCPLKGENIWDNSTFATRVQRVDKLQNRKSVRKTSKLCNQMRRKKRKCIKADLDIGSNSSSISGSANTGFAEAESFGFEPGPLLTISKFQKYADSFMAQYFRKNENATDMVGNDHCKPPIESIEGEYWRIVENATEEIEVLYGADLETGSFGSGFPKVSNQAGSCSDDKYIKSGWNLNNFPRLHGSVLSYESSDISGVLVPWLYIGMCFSSFCWHVEDHHLYSLNYMHWGAPKMWYGVPGKGALKLEEAMRKHLPDLFEEQPDLLHKLVTQLSPSLMKTEGVPVYRCVQNAGEFVLTFPRAYHAGFNCGFNCAEAVNVAPVDWFPHGQIAIELYRDQCRRTSISHDKLLLGAARESVRAHWELNLLRKNTTNNLRWKHFCGKDGILTKAFKERVEVERVRREFLCNPSHARKMENNFDANSERECAVCLFDLHLSAVGCPCSPDKFACLNHAKQLCSCTWDSKFFLFRYDSNELNILVEALEGKLSSVYRWARLDLGLALSSYVSGDNNFAIKSSSSSPEGKMLKEPRMQAGASFPKEWQVNPNDVTSNSSLLHDDSSLQNKRNSSKGELLAKDTKEPVILSSKLKTIICRLSQEDTSYALDFPPKECGMKSPLVLENESIILLSDDEGDNEPVKQVPLVETRSNVVENSEPTDSNDPLSITSVAVTTTVKFQDDISSSHDLEKNISLPHMVQVKEEHDNIATVVESNPPKSMIHVGSSGEATSIKNYEYPQPLRCLGPGKPNTEVSHDRVGSTGISAGTFRSAKAIIGNPSCVQNNLDRSFRQKGPRIAKLVRRINCNVEPLEFGSVLSGKLWCNSNAIFPKGFRSRVRYINVLDPANMCYYISEILDAVRENPLFMVSLELCPSEVFVHVSANRCWEMVRERVNQEITKQHKMGKVNLPPLQPPGSLDGFEMFGFSSPSIVQAIEALDRNRVCTEYWDSRPYSRPQVQIPQISHMTNKIVEQSSVHISNNNHFPILKSLFKKANPEELRALRSFVSDSSSSDRGLANQILNDEIKNRPR